MYYTDYMENIENILDVKDKYNNLLIVFVGNKSKCLDKYTDICDWGFVYPPNSILNEYGNVDDGEYFNNYYRYLEKLWTSIIFVFGANYSKEVVVLFDNTEQEKLHKSCFNRFLSEHAFPCENFKY